MRLRVLAPVLTLAAVGAVALPASASSPATVKITVKPVRANGAPAPGYSVTREKGSTVDCPAKGSSPGALSAGIETCYPTAEYVPACWKSANHTVLCTRDPRKKTLVRIARDGSFGPAKPDPSAARAPLVIQLDDGDVCDIRIGGAWSALPGHPELAGTGSCVKDGATWAKEDAKHNGIDETKASWTVRTAPFGSHTLKTHHVVKAWFVATY